MRNKKRSPNGSGSIYMDNARNQYRAIFSDPAGKRISKRFKTYEDADAWLTELKYQISKELYIPASDITLGAWMIDFLETYVKPFVRPTTMFRYYQLTAIIVPISDQPVQNLNSYSMQKFFNELSNSENVKLKLYKLLRTAANKAVEVEIIRKSFMQGVKAPVYRRKPIEIYSQEELQAILSYLKNPKNTLYHRYYPLILLAATSGMRRGELLALTWDDIDPESCIITINKQMQDLNGELVIVPPKTEAGNRSILLPKAVIDIVMDSRKKLSENPHIFTSKLGNNMHPTNVTRSWHHIQIRAGVEDRTFHALRHTHATMLLASGIPILEVTKRLGHANATTTLNIYGHAIPGYDQITSAKIGEIYHLANGTENGRLHPNCTPSPVSRTETVTPSKIAPTKKALPSLAGTHGSNMVRLVGFEPTHPVPETGALSPEL